MLNVIKLRNAKVVNIILLFCVIEAHIVIWKAMGHFLPFLSVMEKASCLFLISFFHFVGILNGIFYFLTKSGENCKDHE